MQQNTSLTIEKATANWYVMRELCFGAMFRYNRQGAFNIPYGGSSYNYKNLRNKVTYICSPAMKQLFTKAHFSVADFEAFLSATKPSKDDFVFVDPPYDTAFSEYDAHPFTKEDHLRLRNVLLKLQAKWLSVIKKTTYITSLYANQGLYISEYSKRYRHSIKGRSNQHVTHLIIRNYKN